MSVLRTAISDLTGLFSIFGYDVDRMPAGRFISADEMPEPYRGLLAHHHHMTVTLERFHGTPVDVKVLEAIHDEPFYARKILLTKQNTDEVVLFGIMRFNFEWCSAGVKQEILTGETPLGRILIDHDVLRRISTHALLRVTPTEELRGYFKMPAAENGSSDVVYGRLATIFCNNEPAVDLLEIPAPVESVANAN